MIRKLASHALLLGVGLSMTACAISPIQISTPGPVVTRYKIPNSDFPIALGVEVPAGKNIVFLSGMTGPLVDANAPKGSVQAYGNMTVQTIGALGRIQQSLESMGLTMGDIVKLRMFMVGDPDNGGKMDFAGMMAGYKQYFGNRAQPNLPARSAIQVAALAGPGRLIEIEATAVRP